MNVLLLVAAVLGYAAHGPASFETEWQDRASAALSTSHPSEDSVREADLAALPAPLARYLRQAGVLGQSPPRSVYVTFHGGIRSGADQPWMRFTGRQLNTFGASPTRTFLLRPRVPACPLTVLHVFERGHATMRGKVLSLAPVLDASGPEMDCGETVTVCNDMVLLAPAALLAAPIRWTNVSDHEVRGTFTNGTQVVSATLRFDDRDQLVDFASDDRLRASIDGKNFRQQPRSTPIHAYGDFGGHRLIAEGTARWHAPAPEGEFSYVELRFDGSSYDPPTTADPVALSPMGAAVTAGRRGP